MNEDVAYATGHLPKFADEMFKTQGNQFLIPTAEMPLTGMHKDENLTDPKHYVAFTPCFRREKIAYGKDNKGIKRVHCFNKIELYIICNQEDKDVSLTNESLQQSKLNYLKLRQTYRFMLSNLFDFTPDLKLNESDLLLEDKEAIEVFSNFKSRMNECYENNNFNGVTKLLFNYLATDFSRNWLKTETTGLKRRLYLCY